MNIVERRRPQDGQIADRRSTAASSTSASSTTPTICGEKCVLRLLDKTHGRSSSSPSSACPTTRTSAYSRARPLAVRHGRSAPGPTGTGKTTTLYATLAEINNDDDQHHDDRGPGRVRLPVDQPDPDQRAGRRHLRRRPAVDPAPGPRRRSSSARSATSRPRASRCSPRSPATSCSRRSTPPTPARALHRFLDMGIEPFLIASSVLGVVGQRLVRRICPHCVEPYEPTPRSSPSTSAAAATPTRRSSSTAPGCNFCGDTGYFDRIGVYEVLAVTDEIKRADRRRARRTTSIRALADRAGHAHAARRGHPPRRPKT